MGKPLKTLENILIVAGLASCTFGGTKWMNSDYMGGNDTTGKEMFIAGSVALVSGLTANYLRRKEEDDTYNR